MRAALQGAQVPLRTAFCVTAPRLQDKHAVRQPPGCMTALRLHGRPHDNFQAARQLPDRMTALKLHGSSQAARQLPGSSSQATFQAPRLHARLHGSSRLKPRLHCSFQAVRQLPACTPDSSQAARQHQSCFRECTCNSALKSNAKFKVLCNKKRNFAQAPDSSKPNLRRMQT